MTSRVLGKALAQSQYSTDDQWQVTVGIRETWLAHRLSVMLDKSLALTGLIIPPSQIRELECPSPLCPNS